MTPFFRIKPSSYVGLAVHHERLSLIKLKQIKKQMVIEGFAMLALPAGSIVDGKVKHPEQLTHLIRRWVEIYKAEHCAVALALPGSQVINKKIKVAAYLSEQEQSAEISSNLKFYLPGMSERLYFDFIPIKREEQEMEVQLIAARAEQVEIYIDLIQKAGLKIKVVDVDVYAIVRSIRWMAGHLLTETIVILDRDISSAQLILIKQNKVLSVYPIVYDAEDIFLQQIKRGIHFFSTTEPSIVLEKMVLTGYLSDSEKFRQLLQAELFLSVMTIDIFNQMIIDPLVNSEEFSKSASELLAALGLALRGFPRDGN